MVAAHLFGAFMWSFAYSLPHENEARTRAEMMASVSLLIIAWELVTVLLAVTAAVVFVKRLVREIEEV
jgi:hypothetical protein